VCQNNYWAISTPAKVNCSAPTLAQRGLAYGMHSVQVDGNDIFAVVRVVREAADRARMHNRPTFIEAVTYRLGDHTTADDARRYRDSDVVDAWLRRDPLIRLRNWLEQRDLWDESQEQAQRAENESFVKGVVKRAEGIEPPVPDDMFVWMYSDMPPTLDMQRRTLRTSSLGQGFDGSGA
jgi:pyruvate dehydrogenase E1 component alpha subunit